MQADKDTNSNSSAISADASTSQSGETDRELKAYIYQQLAEMQPYLIPESQIAVTVHHIPPRSANEGNESSSEGASLPDPADEGAFIVKLIATMEGGRLEAEGHATDVYQAFGQAKGTMVQQLNEVHNALMDPAEREQEIQSFLSGERTLH